MRNISKIVDLFRVKKSEINVHYSNNESVKKVVDFLKVNEVSKTNVVLLFVGTSRGLTYDTLSPLVGTLLKNDNKCTIPIFGTMESPVTALNVKDIMKKIKTNFPEREIIVIDAITSMDYDLGEIVCRSSSTIILAREHKKLHTPKELIKFGDISIGGVVNRMSNEDRLNDDKLVESINSKIDFNIIRDMSITLYLSLSNYFLN